MKVQILGIDGGITPSMRGTSLLIDHHTLIDAGSVASGLTLDQQLLIENIFITHSHLDHIADLAYLADNHCSFKNTPIHIWAHPKVLSAIKKHLFNDIIWPDFTKIPNEKKPIITLNSLLPTMTSKNLKITPVNVHHSPGATGYFIFDGETEILYTGDTGPTDEIWEMAHQKNLSAIFSEISFPNREEHLAKISCHHTPNSFFQEWSKMPKNVPIYVGHFKPPYLEELQKEFLELTKKIPQLHLSVSQSQLSLLPTTKPK